MMRFDVIGVGEVMMVVVVVVAAAVDLVVVVVVVGKDCGIVGVDWRRFIAERRNGRPSLVCVKEMERER